MGAAAADAWGLCARPPSPSSPPDIAGNEKYAPDVEEEGGAKEGEEKGEAEEEEEAEEEQEADEEEAEEEEAEAGDVEGVTWK